ncbi:DUF1700 domain-containing protein [Mesoplasma syrphidae]|uniref:DUF1700 domain-containing protein n=1 Tax=Mesoplasma syrphidae TaxID=225999 RepID=A0A2K9CCT2_9MOLU|nr:DUF1700 domain-containing protein [Mesoplasma syrphidae]AUF83464.1 DUF1700 domain-containing protein [Mesoplasma syrphidae]
MNKKEIKLKKKWLQKLRKALKLLAEDDANDIIESYEEKINEEFNELGNMQIVLDQLSNTEVIAREIYLELGIDYNAKPKHEKKSKTQKTKVEKVKVQKPQGKSVGIKLAFTFPNFIMSIFAIALALISAALYLVAFVLVIGFPFMITIFFVTYDFAIAISLFVLILGLVPLLTIALWYIAKFFEKSTKVIINGIFIVYTDERPFAMLFKKSMINKIMLISAITFAIITGFGAAINLAPENSVLASNYNNNYRYSQVTEINVADEIKDASAVHLIYDELSSSMIRNTNEKFDSTLEYGSIKLVRHYNIKEKYTLDTKVDVVNLSSSNNNDYQIYLSSNLPWNAIVGVTSFERYEIFYNFKPNNSGEVV